MTIRAYREIYLNNAQSAAGDAFDYAINACGIAGDDFTKMFAASSVGRRMERGEPAYLAGKSGIEIASEVIFETTGQAPPAGAGERFERSPEYWIGWAAAYYQWYSGRKYKEIFRVFSYEDLRRMYFTLHEADITKFAEIADGRMREFYPETNLKRIRTAYGCTQAELAKRSGVALRSVQMYEQRNKDINKANADTVYRLSTVLGCTMEDLLEK